MFYVRFIIYYRNTATCRLYADEMAFSISQLRGGGEGDLKIHVSFTVIIFFQPPFPRTSPRRRPPPTRRSRRRWRPTLASPPATSRSSRARGWAGRCLTPSCTGTGRRGTESWAVTCTVTTPGCLLGVGAVITRSCWGRGSGAGWAPTTPSCRRPT